jgi:glyoxylase-like metal-dependent hydrolase (beta-lactamase superfamily II)
MLQLKSFTFGPFQENTYILWDETDEAVIIDPGNTSNAENQQVKNFLADKNLKLTRLILTHGHVDHIAGNKFIFDTYGLLPEVNKHDLPLIENHGAIASMYGIPYEASPLPKTFLNEGEFVKFGNTTFEMLFTPGHSPGSITFYNRENNFIICGDVLFYGSIGRTDLPGGDYDTLINAIKTKLFPLGDAVKVYNGHGPATTIGHERACNPFLV